MNKRRVLSTLVVIGALWLGVPASGARADSELPLGFISRERIIIAGQVRLAHIREQRAFELLSTGATDAASLDVISRMVQDGYALVRFAVSGLREAKSMSKYSSRMLDIQDGMLEEVRAHLRSCMTELDRARAGSRDALGPATTNLKLALARLEATLELMP